MDPKERMKGISRRIREMRTQRGWSQASLADMVGITRASVLNIETGFTKAIKSKTLHSMAQAFGVTMDEIYAGQTLGLPLWAVTAIEGLVTPVGASKTVPNPETRIPHGQVRPIAVIGKHFEPKYTADQVLYAGPAATHQSAIGHDCLLRLGDGAYYLGVMEPGSKPEFYHIRHYGRDDQENQFVVDAHPILWVKNPID